VPRDGGGIVVRNDCLADIVSNQADKQGCPSRHAQTGLGSIEPNPAPKTMCAAFKRPVYLFLATEIFSASATRDEADVCLFSSCLPLRQSQEEPVDFSRGQIRAFVVHKVTRVLREGNLDLSEILVQDIGPIGFEDRIMAPPQDAGWHGNTRRPLSGAGHDSEAAGILPDVPVEAALHVAWPHEVVEPALDNGVESILLVRPVVEEMADVRPAGLA
jgi:hypothetical protein